MSRTEHLLFILLFSQCNYDQMPGMRYVPLLDANKFELFPPAIILELVFPLPKKRRFHVSNANSE